MRGHRLLMLPERERTLQEVRARAMEISLAPVPRLACSALPGCAVLVVAGVYSAWSVEGVAGGFFWGFGLFALMYRLLGGRANGPWIASMVARSRRCPVCGYDLDGLAAEGDGCTLCPECGAAWRVRNAATETPNNQGEGS